MKLVVLIFSILCLWLRLAMGQPYEFAWDHSPSYYSNKVSRYILSWGPTNGVYTSQLIVNSNQTQAWSGHLPIGEWYFIVLAVSVDGLGSLPSNEVVVTNRFRPPMPPIDLFSRTVSRTWTLPPGVVLQKSITLTNWMEHVRNLSSNAITIRVSDDIFGRQQYFRLYTNPLPPMPGAARNGRPR